MESNLVISLKF